MMSANSICKQTPIDISILIVNYNTRDLLTSCLKTIYQFPQNISFEILVSDNNSKDGAEEAIRKEFPQVIVIQNGSNLGFGSAMNIAATQARGRYFVALSPDTKVPPNTLRYLVDYMESHSDINVIGCRLVGRDGRTQLSCARFPTPLRVFSLFSRLDKLFPIPALQTYYDKLDKKHLALEDWNIDKPIEVDTVLGAFFIIPRELFNKVGGFDSRYFMYYEEVDLFRKLRAIGHRVFFLPEVYIVHYGGEATKQEYARMRFEQQRSLLLYLQKWYGAVAAEVTRWFLIGIAALRLAKAMGSPRMAFLKATGRLNSKRTALTMLRGLLQLDLRHDIKLFQKRNGSS